VRQSISATRREEAAKATKNLAPKEGKVLSFYSFGSEINLYFLNSILIQESRLVLPRIENDLLVPYQVFDLQKSLQKSFLGGLEPNPEFSSKISLSEIQMILVPALAFDSEYFRLGYGKGHYDQFLKTTGNIKTIGIGFKEQLFQALLPRDPWDVPLKDLSLF
jgi:5-formyltetrahydrofolate cyclo-ligase